MALAHDPPPARLRPLVILLTLGLLYRVAYLWELSTLPDWYRLVGDEGYFMNQARHFGEPGPCQPFHMSPLFIVGLHYFRMLFGEDPLRWRLVLLLLGMSSAVLCYDIARRTISLAAGHWALGLYLFCGPLLYYESNLDLCTVASTATLGALWCAVRWQRSGSLRDYAGAGLCVGIGILARPNAALLCGALFLGPLLLRRGQALGPRLLQAALAPALALLCTVPVTVHNLRCDPDPVWVSDSGGLNLYIGNHRAANGTFNVPPRLPEAGDIDSQQAAFVNAAAQALGQPRVSPARASAYWAGEARKEIAADPAAWLRLLARKALLVWNDQDQSNSRSYEFRCELMHTLGPWLVQVGYLTPLAALGLLLALWGWRQHLFLALFAGAYCAALTLFFVLGHYRQVLLPLFILLAVLAGQTLQGWWGAGQRRRILLCLLPLLLLALRFNHPILEGTTRPDDAFKHAYALHTTGDLRGAERWYLESLNEAPTLPAARNLALLYTRSHRRPEALRLWALVLRLARAEGRADVVTEAERYRAALRAPSDGSTPAPAPAPAR